MWHKVPVTLGLAEFTQPTCVHGARAPKLDSRLRSCPEQFLEMEVTREPFFLSGQKRPWDQAPGVSASVSPQPPWAEELAAAHFSVWKVASLWIFLPWNLSRHGPQGSLSPCFVASRGHLASSCLAHKVKWPENLGVSR